MTDKISVEYTEATPVVQSENPAPEAVEETQEEQAADEADVAEDHDGEEAGEEGEQRPDEPGKEKTPHGVQKKLDKLTARWKGEERLRKEADARAEALEQRLAKMEAKPQGEPQLADFDYDPQAYLAARAKWEVHNTLEAERKQKAEAEARAVVAKRDAEWKQKLDEFEDDHPGARDAIQGPIPFTAAMGEAIKDSPVGPQIAYYLAQHPDEVMALAQQNQFTQIREILKLEATFIPTSQPRKLTTAPPPIKPLDPKAPIRKRLEDMSVGELIVWNRKRRAKGLR